MSFVVPTYEDGKFFIRSWCSKANLLIVAKMKVLQPNGFVQNLMIEHVPNSNRTEKEESQKTPKGEILSVIVYSKSTAAYCRRGECYIATGYKDDRAQILLISDYISETDDLSYVQGGSPHLCSSIDGSGIIKRILGTNPAAGAEMQETIPTNATWLIKSLYLALVTDVNVANRTVELRITDGTNIALYILPVSVQAASLSHYYTYMTTLGREYANGSDARYKYHPLPIMKLPQGWTVETATNNIQVGDNYGAPIMIVEEWIED